MSYIFSIVRFVPDQLRGEYVNVAAVLGDESSDLPWSILALENWDRAKALDPDAMLVAREVVQDLPAELDSIEGESRREVLTELGTRYGRLLQVTAPTVLDLPEYDGACAVARTFLVDRTKASRQIFTKEGAVKALREQLLEAGLTRGGEFDVKVPMNIGTHAFEIDAVVYNGKALMISQAFSYRRKKPQDVLPQVHAWGFFMLKLRDGDAATVKLAERSLVIPQDVDVKAITIPAASQSQAQLETLSEARKVFADVDAVEYTVGAVESVAADAAAMVEAATALR